MMAERMESVTEVAGLTAGDLDLLIAGLQILVLTHGDLLGTARLDGPKRDRAIYLETQLVIAVKAAEAADHQASRVDTVGGSLEWTGPVQLIAQLPQIDWCPGSAEHHPGEGMGTAAQATCRHCGDLVAMVGDQLAPHTLPMGKPEGPTAAFQVHLADADLVASIQRGLADEAGRVIPADQVWEDLKLRLDQAEDHAQLQGFSTRPDRLAQLLNSIDQDGEE